MVGSPTIEGYELEKEIGSGAYGTVYKAHSPEGQAVALKVLNAELAIPEVAAARFRREFDVARTLEHPHIVGYRDFGIKDGRPYIVMEYVEGSSLWNHVNRLGPLTRQEAIRMTEQIGSALDAGHQVQVLHRDVKPHNILLTPDGNAKLADFGLVKDLNDSTNLTGDKEMLGTPFFMAPEQFLDSKSADHRADLYGLAASVFFALSGKIPFKFRGLGLWEKKLRGQFLPVDETVPNVTMELVQKIGTCLHPEPDQRPQTAAAFVAQLRVAAKIGSSAKLKRVQPAEAERRAFLRRKCNFRAVCAPAEKGDGYPAQIVDMSTHGLCIVADRMFPVNTLIDLSFQFTHDNEAWDYQIRVVNIKGLKPGQWRHGFRFVQAVDRAELLALLNEDKSKMRVKMNISRS